jgi:hypothetical protein
MIAQLLSDYDILSADLKTAIEAADDADDEDTDRNLDPEESDNETIDAGGIRGIPRDALGQLLRFLLPVTRKPGRWQMASVRLAVICRILNIDDLGKVPLETLAKQLGVTRSLLSLRQLEVADQEFLRAKCADGLVYQHVVRSYPSHAAGQLLKLEKDLEDQKSGYAKMILEMQSLRHDHAQALLAWDHEKSAFIQQLAQLQAELQSAQGELQNTQATLNWTEDQLQNHRHSLDEVLNSASWKMTQPFRALGGK